MTEEPAQQSSDKKLALVLFLAVIVLWGGYWLAMGKWGPADWTERGQFGDMFGAVNALVSAFAFAGLIYAITLQRTDLGLQREELKLQRQELADTREVLDKQEKQLRQQTETMQRQQFEGTFFQLVTLFSSIVAALEVVSPIIQGNRGKGRGRDALKIMVLELSEMWKGTAVDLPPHLRGERAYTALYINRQGELSPYFRTLYHVFKFVDESPVHDKKRYTSFARAQLSPQELILLAHNCANGGGTEKFKALVERYALLEHLPPDNLVPEGTISTFHPSAFGWEPPAESV